MTTTITVGGTGAGKTSARRAFAAYLTTATADTEIGRRVRGLLTELDEIAEDRAMACRYLDPGTWLDDLVREERDVWDHIVEALSSKNTMKETT
ncbi:hypothetical protein F0L68_39750 [Solihabitans fulvus]|uniref:Uncharacterized protein n=1 Tax=Solihabitans fulvus TaxID=1892852 RepID=A0A5B2WE24_9PSEU|nr:hypothetical protein [Solihabitans fulvus]KAA2248686.1 hypothetical protein F0L68_39750 [Solihabitans fulvus]